MQTQIPTQAWYIACQSKALKTKPLPIQLLGQSLVLFRNKKGQPVALLDRCPHRNAPLSQGWVERGTLVCPYHGWRFESAGQCTEIPGRCQQSSKAAHNARYFASTEQDGLIWVYGTPQITPEIAPYTLPHKRDPSYRSFIWELEVKTSLPRLAENFLDATHTHFVHSGLIRQRLKRRPTQVQIVRQANQVEARYLNDQSYSGLIFRLLAPGCSRLDAFGRFILPCISQLEYRTDKNYKLLISACATPRNSEYLKVYAVVSFCWGLPHWLGEILAKPLFWLAIQQDKKMVEAQSQTIVNHGGPEFISTEIDLLSPHITWLLNKHAKGELPASDHLLEKTVELWL